MRPSPFMALLLLALPAALLTGCPDTGGSETFTPPLAEGSPTEGSVDATDPPTATEAPATEAPTATEAPATEAPTATEATPSQAATAAPTQTTGAPTAPVTEAPTEAPTQPTAAPTPPEATPSAAPPTEAPTATLPPASPSAAPPTEAPTPTMSMAAPTPILDEDGDGYTVDSDCDDGDAAVHPGAPEACNGVDDNCNQLVDEGVTTTFYADDDADGFGDPRHRAQACQAPEGYEADDGDCDDGDPSVHPGADETCDDADEDCDRRVDEGLDVTFYLDRDDDGFGDDGSTTQACILPPFHVDQGGDCDDLSAAVNPGATEVCNDRDDDCDAVTDEGFDGDADGTADCIDDDADGFTEDEGDCDDTRADTYPGAPDPYGDGIDNDCDGQLFAERVITFEAYPSGVSPAAGAAILDQYAPWGVYFRTDGTTTAPPTIRTTSGVGFQMPTSGFNVLGSDGNNSAGLGAWFAPDLLVVKVSIRDTDDDCTFKILYAFDEEGNILDQDRSDGQCDSRGPRPRLEVEPVDADGQPIPIARVEFDTQPGPAGGSFDGTYFTIDDFTFVYADRAEDDARTQVIDFETSPAGADLTVNTALTTTYAPWGVTFETDGSTADPPTLRGSGATGLLRPASVRLGLGTDSLNSAGIVAVFDAALTVTRVSLRDIDNDGTQKTLFAFDAAGNLIDSDLSKGTTDPRAPLPLIQVFSPLDEAGDLVPIARVEFDTQAGTAGGSADGTYFTIDDFSFTYFGP